MDLEEKFLVKVSGVQSLSSSVQSTPEKNGHSDDASRSPELLQEFLKSSPKKELLRMCFYKDRKNISSKRKMPEIKSISKVVKKQDSKKVSTLSNQPSRKQHRKSKNPTRLRPVPEQVSDNGHSDSWICKNSACRAFLSADEKFCRRCTCCICHLFDSNKDPSLWLVCSSESDEGDSCGFSCHIECALQHEKMGVVDHGQLMQLDGAYCCASCGKVTGILGCWKKQLNIAKDARRVDVLCYRLYLSYKLLDGTSRFKELHDIVVEAKAKLETEVGPVNGVSAKMVRGIVSRLSIASEVQKLCSLAMEKADGWPSFANPDSIENSDGSLPPACKFVFEEVTASSVKIILIDKSSFKEIKGYKLWYYKSNEELLANDPVCEVPNNQKRILLSNLQPGTEYTFRIISYTDMGQLGYSEAKCFTRSADLAKKVSSLPIELGRKKENLEIGPSSSGSKTEPNLAVADSGFKVRDLGKVVGLGWTQDQGPLEGFCSVDTKNCCREAEKVKPKISEEQLPAASRGLDLNVVSVPDLNEELVPPFESAKDEDHGCTLQKAVEADDDAASRHAQKISLAKSHGSGDSHTWMNGPTGEVPAVDSRIDACKKRVTSINEETHDCNSTLANGSPLRVSDGTCSLDENYEYCVKVFRWLECEGHIKQEFRLKLLTWFSLRSTEQERRVVNTFIQTLLDDPCSLAGQLIDSFSDIISNKRPRNA